MKTFKVLEYDARGDCHVCEDENGKHHKIDLHVSGCFGDIDPKESLIGKYVTVGRTHPYISIAHDVKIVDAPQSGMAAA